MKKVFVVAGEASADAHAASFVRSLRAEDPKLKVYGVGGQKLREVGFETLIDSSQFSVVGFTELISQAGNLISAYRNLKETLTQDPPDVAVLLDLPDFNLVLAKHLKKLGVPIIYYISPQVWAWRKYRIKKIKHLVKKMLVLFPFEKAFYESQGVPVRFVGHPLLDELSARKKFRSQEEIQKAPSIAILPGSRASEIKYHSSTLLKTIEVLENRYPSMQVHIPIASTIDATVLRQQMPHPKITWHEGNASKIVEEADIALVASGTATLETAVIGTPFALFYRASFSTAFIFKNFVQTQQLFGMPNLLLGKEAFKEFGQESFTVRNLFGECVRMIENEKYRQSLIEAAGQCLSSLEEPSQELKANEKVADRVAQEVLISLDNTSPEVLGESEHVFQPA